MAIGENFSGRDVDWGDGVYKSLNGGLTWKRMGLEPFKDDNYHVQSGPIPGEGHLDTHSKLRTAGKRSLGAGPHVAIGSAGGQNRR